MKNLLPALTKILKEEVEELQNTIKQKNIFVLVGPPSVGKSTWISSTFHNEKPYIINRDDIVEQVASSQGWTYDDLFVTPPPDAVIGEVDQKYGTVEAAPPWMTWAKTVFSKVQQANNQVQSLFAAKVGGATASNKDVVVDMTNMNAAARKGALNAIKGSEEQYKKIAVVFPFQGAEHIIQKVAQKRAEAASRMGKSKTIPPEAFKRMFDSFSHPTKAEGFDEIVTVDNRAALEKLANS